MSKELSTEQTMTSREIAEITGKRHDHVLRDITKLNQTYVEIGVPISGVSSYKTKQNKSAVQYHLTKVQSLDLMSGYDTKLRIKIIRRWEDLENKNTLPNFSNPVLAARAWADAEEKRQIAENTVEQKNGLIKDLTKGRLFSVKQMANYLCFEGIGRNKLFDILRDKKVLNENNIPYQRFVNSGDCSIRVVEKNGKSYDQAVFTIKGIESVRKALLKRGYIQDKTFNPDIIEECRR